MSRFADNSNGTEIDHFNPWILLISGRRELPLDSIPREHFPAVLSCLRFPPIQYVRCPALRLQYPRWTAGPIHDVFTLLLDP